ncbi:MAG: hypothetical protein FWC06_08420 [Treponema sp.]|nr:hypothetical protein [Treponema sp.]
MGLGNIFQSVQYRIKALNSGQRRSLVLLCTGVFVFILILSVVISMCSSSNEMYSDSSKEKMFYSPIPAEELFLPDEPNYVPGVLLDREQKSSWTIEDARRYWQDPLGADEQKWRDRIEKVIDDYLERVP